MDDPASAAVGWEIFVRVGGVDRRVKAGAAGSVGQAADAVRRLLPDVEPAGAYAYGWVYVPDERDPLVDSLRPLKATRARGSHDVYWSRPGL